MHSSRLDSALVNAPIDDLRHRTAASRGRHSSAMSHSHRRARSTGALLFVVCLAQFMVILDVLIVNVALPGMRRALHFSASDLQWVVSAYTLAFAGFIMLGGRCADLIGRRRVFMAGTALFALASLACALSESQGLLIGARVLQGLGGAMVSPATLAIITSSLPEGRERNRGLGLWAAVGGLGASSGALLGGVLTQSFGWPAIFAINVPLGVIAIAMAARVLPVDEASREPKQFDARGAVLVTAALVGLSYGIVRSESLGWGSTEVLVPLLLTAPLLAAFVFVEARVAQRPLVPLSIFRISQLRTANLVVGLMYFGLFSMFFFITLYLQQVLHYDALQAGLAFLPITVSVLIGSSLAPRLVGSFGLRSVAAGGMLLATAGLAMFTGVRAGGSYLAQVLPGAVPSGLGMGLALVSSTIAATQGVPPSQRGLASSLLNMSRLFGGALGLAVLNAIASAASHPAGVQGPAQALANGYGLAFTGGAVVTLTGALLALTLPRSRQNVVQVATTNPASVQVIRYAAFTDDPRGGNPAGVVLDAASLDDEQMLQIAQHVGYSETAFLRPRPDAPGDFDVRYFSPEIEVPFCGHATVAAGVALAERDGPGEPVFHVKAGPVRVSIRVDSSGRASASLTSVRPHVEEATDGAIAEALRALNWRCDDLDPQLPPRIAYAGVRHLILAAATRARLSALDYDFEHLKCLMLELDLTTMHLVWRKRDDLYHARNPFPVGGVYEDPATGAAAAAFGGYLRALSLVPTPPRVTVLQGQDMGRPSLIIVDIGSGDSGITVTGSAVPIA
jgi:EmrB/QacA subfamily drug resistance transporter/PhzF family phenazine biosynthesis protein